jgi:uncharacterized protein with ATP-grasp and redox domains
LKVEAECGACLLHRGWMEIQKATDDPLLRFKALSALFSLLAEGFNPDAVSAHFGTKRDRLIRKITGNEDPYAEKKRISNQKSLETLPLVKNLVSQEKSAEARFRKACLSAIVGNIMEFDMLGYSFSFGDIEKLIAEAEQDLAIDDIPEIFSKAKEAKNILYLTDNAGEIAFDTLLVQELKKLGARAVVVVKDKPIFNDATMADAETVGIHEVASDVITLGTDTIGLILEEVSNEFLSQYNSADLVVAKGMGYAETLTELKLTTPHALLLRTKCQPVANLFGVGKNKNIAKLLLPPGR